MRKRFELQPTLGSTPIEEVKIPLNSRDKLPEILLALQQIYITPSLHNEIFILLEKIFSNNKKNTGRWGMDLWFSLVLGSIRVGMSIGYDRLEYMANYDSLIRAIMGVENTFDPKVSIFSYRTIHDNVSLIDDKTLHEINDIVVRYGQSQVMKEGEKFKIKGDSYAFETDVHFPSDVSLARDAANICINLSFNISRKYNFRGWRKKKDWKNRIKWQLRNLLRVVYNVKAKDRDSRIEQETQKYLELLQTIYSKTEVLILQMFNMDLEDPTLENALHMISKHMNLIDRRLLKKEKIPHEEKVHSIYQPHTEWVQKGKSNNKVELGIKLFIATDQHSFIVDYNILKGKADSDETVPAADRLIYKLGQSAIESLSFDKGFYSKVNKELVKLYIPNLIIPKKGKLNKVEKEEESSKSFKKYKNKHSAIESNINCLEHHGLDKCPDRTEEAYDRYVGFGVLAYNLHKLGKILKEKALKKYKQTA